MFESDTGPIKRFDWGIFTIADQVHAKGVGAGKDIRLIGAEVSAWTERKGHMLTADMITGVYDRGIEILIIGNGVFEALKCPEAVKDSIASQDYRSFASWQHRLHVKSTTSYINKAVGLRYWRMELVDRRIGE